MSDDKKDLIKLFGLEGQIKRRTIIDDTQKDMDDKTPFQVSNEIIEVIGIMNTCVSDCDVEGLLKCVQALQFRVNALQEAAFSIKMSVDKVRKKKPDDN